MASWSSLGLPAFVGGSAAVPYHATLPAPARTATANTATATSFSLLRNIARNTPLERVRTDAETEPPAPTLPAANDIAAWDVPPSNPAGTAALRGLAASK